MAKSKKLPIKASDEAEQIKNEKTISILDALRNTAAPTLEELADNVRYELPAPTLPSLSERDKKLKYKYF